MPAKPEPDPRIIIPMPQTLIDEVDDFRWTQRIPSRAEAIRELIRRGLTAKPEVARLATLAIVARPQPAAACIAVHDMPERSIPAMPALRSTSSGRPRYLPSAFALAMPWAWRRRRSS